MIKVLIVDDHAFVRSGLRALLGGQEDIDIVGECADGADLPRADAAAGADVVLMDVRMPRMSGIEATRLLVRANRRSRVVLIAARIMGDDLAQASDAGAVGLLLKGGDPQVLLVAVRQVAAGGTAWLTGTPARAQP